MTSKKAFNTVLVTDVHERGFKYECDDFKGYKKHLKETLIWLKRLEDTDDLDGLGGKHPYPPIH